MLSMCLWRVPGTRPPGDVSWGGAGQPPCALEPRCFLLFAGLPNPRPFPAGGLWHLLPIDGLPQR